MEAWASGIRGSMQVSGKRLAADIHAEKRNRVKAQLLRCSNQFGKPPDVVPLKCATRDDLRASGERVQGSEAGG